MPILFRTVGSVAGPSFALRPTAQHRGFRDLFRIVRMPVTCAVIERPDGLVLIDAGWSRAQCAFPEQDPGRVTTLLLGLEVRPEDALASQLLSLGYDPADVKHVIATHLHIDHIGGAADFPNAAVHTTPAEWAARRKGRRGGYGPGLDALGDRLQVHGLASPAHLGFPASHDVFGDGTVWMLDARGHTDGSVAVAVKLADGWLLHAGDACMFATQIDAGAKRTPTLYARMTSHDPRAQDTSFEALENARDSHGARIVPSHDPQVFDTLPTTREHAWRMASDPAPGKSTRRTSGRPPTRPQSNGDG